MPASEPRLPDTLASPLPIGDPRLPDISSADAVPATHIAVQRDSNTPNGNAVPALHTGLLDATATLYGARLPAAGTASTYFRFLVHSAAR